MSKMFSHCSNICNLNKFLKIKRLFFLYVHVHHFIININFFDIQYIMQFTVVRFIFHYATGTSLGIFAEVCRSENVTFLFSDDDGLLVTFKTGL